MYIAAYDTADGTIVGIQQGPSAPADSPGRGFAEISESDYATISGNALWPGGGGHRYRWNGTAIEEIPDSRPRIRVEADKASVLNDPADSVTVTISVLRENGTVNNSVNTTGMLIVEGESGRRRLRIQISSGVYSRTVSGERLATMFGPTLRISSTPDYRTENYSTLEIFIEDAL